MQHTVFFTLGWIFAALKVLVTIVGLTLKHRGLERSPLFNAIYIASKVTPPLFIACFIADAALMRATDMIGVYMGLLLVICVLLVLAAKSRSQSMDR